MPRAASRFLEREGGRLKMEDGTSGGSMLRLFVAISLPDAVKFEIEKAQRQFFGEWTANHVELIRSELSSSGSRYTTLAEIPLIEKP
jgi:2'-5' RNA ligase